MGKQHGLSRRHMLAMSVAAGGFAIGGAYRDATVPVAKKS
jgi:hypothetical protein